MGVARWVCTGAVVAAVAVAVPLCGAASAAPTPAPTPSPRPTASTPVASAPSVPSLPSDAEVSRAQAAAAAAAKEVADITAQVASAEARLVALQRAVAEAVAADEQAQQQLADADAAVQQATVALAAARRARDTAHRDLSASAALMYMQGGDLQNMTTLLLSPPGVVSDLAVVLDQQARHVQANLDAASVAAVDAESQERVLVFARDSRARAVTDAGVQRATAEKEAARAGAEAAKLGQQQEVLTARLAELEGAAASLVGLREAAARLGTTGLLGVQVLGDAPRVAQGIARAKVASYGWDEGEFVCLVALWNAESGWSWSATNPSSGAYGIPQALPGWKMAAAGSDWLTNPATQITWGMTYVRSEYGSPCKAYTQFLGRSPHWY